MDASHVPGQTVQGFSAVLDAGGGATGRCRQWLRREGQLGRFPAARLQDSTRLQDGQWRSGAVAVESFIGLRDPDKHIPFKLTNDTAAERLLTGADFDIESVRFDDRGDLWFGDEFGPGCCTPTLPGRLLEAPIPLPGVKAAENATITQGETANLPGSGGFEGMAASSDGRTCIRCWRRRSRKTRPATGASFTPSMSPASVTSASRGNIASRSRPMRSAT
jgi:hypothetical protein